mgnify:CR=1 FL=1
MTALATVDDIVKLWRELKPSETERAEALLEVVSSTLIVEADKLKKDLVELVKKDENYANVVKSVVVDIVARTLLTSTTSEPLSQESQSANGYTWSGTYLVPGGGIFIKDSELKRLGLKKQRYGVVDFYAET